MSKVKIAVLFGGRSGEHEVSLVSAASVVEAMDKEKYEIQEIGITEDGVWLMGKNCLECFKLKEFNDLIEVDLATLNVDVVFPVLHGTYGEDGKLQGMLEMYDVAYVGCGVAASAVGMDKDFSKRLVRSIVGVNVVDWQDLSKRNWMNSGKNVDLKFDYPVFVKPARLGSAVGISKVKNEGELIKALDEAFSYDVKVLIEKGMDVREIEVAVLGNDELVVSEPGEVLVGGEFYDFNDKYVNGVSSTQIPVENLDSEIYEKIKKYAEAVFRALGLAGLSRIDFFVEKSSGEIYFNEVNTMPGFTSISMYPKLMEYVGVDYSELIDRLVSLGVEAHKERAGLKLSFASGSDWYEGEMK